MYVLGRTKPHVHRGWNYNPRETHIYSESYLSVYDENVADSIL